MASIKIHSNHGHTLQTAETLRFLPADNNLKSTFIEYFNNGLGIIESSKYHENILSLKHGFKQQDYANGSLNPTYRCVQNWYETWRLNNLGPRSGSGLIEVNIYSIIFSIIINIIICITVNVLTYTLLIYYNRYLD